MMYAMYIGCTDSCVRLTYKIQYTFDYINMVSRLIFYIQSMFVW